MYRGVSSGLIVVLCAMLGACSSLTADLPSDFMQLRTANHEFKATSPDGARVWAREFEDYDQGGVSFWAEALKNDLTEGRGYVLESSDSVRDGEGNEGRQMQLKTTFGGERWGYLVAVFVLPGSSSNTIRVFEFTAREAVFETYLEQVSASVATLQK